LTPARSTCRGFLGLDAVLAVGLAMLLFVAVTAAYRYYANAEARSDARTELRLAAEAELLRIQASGLAPDEEAASQPGSFTDSDIVLRIFTRPGEGIWAGLTHVTVVAGRRVPGGWTQVELTAYALRRETRS
jgi:hypothetical protein